MTGYIEDFLKPYGVDDLNESSKDQKQTMRRSSILPAMTNADLQQKKRSQPPASKEDDQQKDADYKPVLSDESLEGYAEWLNAQKEAKDVAEATTAQKPPNDTSIYEDVNKRKTMNDVLGTEPSRLQADQPILRPDDNNLDPEQQQNVAAAQDAFDDASSTILLDYDKMPNGLKQASFTRKAEAWSSAGLMASPNSILKSAIYSPTAWLKLYKYGNLAGGKLVNYFAGGPDPKESASQRTLESIIGALEYMDEPAMWLIDEILPSYDYLIGKAQKDAAEKGYDIRADGFYQQWGEKSIRFLSEVLPALITSRGAMQVSRFRQGNKALEYIARNSPGSPGQKLRAAGNIQREMVKDTVVQGAKDVAKSLPKTLGAAVGIGLTATAAESMNLAPEESMFINLMGAALGQKTAGGLFDIGRASLAGTDWRYAATAKLLGPRQKNVDIGKAHAMREYAGNYPVSSFTKGGMTASMETMCYQLFVGQQKAHDLVKDANDNVRDKIKEQVWGEVEPDELDSVFLTTSGQDKAISKVVNELYNPFQDVSEGLAPTTFPTHQDAVQSVSNHLQTAYSNISQAASNLHEHVMKSLPREGTVTKQFKWKTRDKLKQINDRLSTESTRVVDGITQVTQGTQPAEVSFLLKELRNMQEFFDGDFSPYAFGEKIKQLNMLDAGDDRMLQKFLGDLRRSASQDYLRMLKKEFPDLLEPQKTANQYTRTKYEYFDPDRDQINQFVRSVHRNADSAAFEQFGSGEKMQHIQKIATEPWAPAELQDSLNQLSRTLWDSRIGNEAVYGTNPASRSAIKVDTIKKQREWIQHVPMFQQVPYHHLLEHQKDYNNITNPAKKQDFVRAKVVQVAMGSATPNELRQLMGSIEGIEQIKTSVAGIPVLEEVTRRLFQREAWNILTGGSSLSKETKNGMPIEAAENLVRNSMNPKKMRKIEAMLGSDVAYEITNIAEMYSNISTGLQRFANTSLTAVQQQTVKLMEKLGNAVRTFFDNPKESTGEIITGVFGFIGLGKILTNPELAKAVRQLSEYMNEPSSTDARILIQMQTIRMIIEDELTRQERIEQGLVQENEGTQMLLNYDPQSNRRSLLR